MPVPQANWSDAERAIVRDGLEPHDAKVVSATGKTIRILYGAGNCFELPTSITASGGERVKLLIVLDETKSCPEIVDGILIFHAIDLELAELSTGNVWLVTEYVRR